MLLSGGRKIYNCSFRTNPEANRMSGVWAGFVIEFEAKEDKPSTWRVESSMGFDIYLKLGFARNTRLSMWLTSNWLHHKMSLGEFKWMQQPTDIIATTDWHHRNMRLTSSQHSTANPTLSIRQNRSHRKWRFITNELQRKCYFALNPPRSSGSIENCVSDIFSLTVSLILPAILKMHNEKNKFVIA